MLISIFFFKVIQVTTDNASNFVKSFTKFHIDPIKGMKDIIPEADGIDEDNENRAQSQPIPSTSGSGLLQRRAADEEEEENHGDDSEEEETRDPVPNIPEQVQALDIPAEEESEEPVEIEDIATILTDDNNARKCYLSSCQGN